MTKYISEEFTDEYLDKLTHEYFYLIGAECGSGKTTAIFEKLVPYAEKNNKKVLFLCNRIFLKDQLLEKYLKNYDKENSLYRFGNLTLIMYQSILGFYKKYYQVIMEEYDYIIIDEAHLIYDASDYDYGAYIFCHYLNEQHNVLISLSGTPNSVLRLGKYINREINILREVDRNNNNMRNIFLVDNKEEFLDLRMKYLNNNYQLLQLISRTSQIDGFKKDFDAYEVACAVSKHNKEAKRYMGAIDEQVKDQIVSNGKLVCDALVTTKFLDVGVSIEAERNFVICYECVELPNTIEQFASRVRIAKNLPFHVDIIFYVKRPYKTHIDDLKEKLEDIELVYTHEEDYAKIIESNEKYIELFGGFGEFETGMKTVKLEKINPITKAFLKEKIEYYEQIHDAEEAIEYFANMFSNMYPNAKIIKQKYKELKNILENLFKEGQEKIELYGSQQTEFREEIHSLKYYPKHQKYLPGLKKIKELLIKSNLEYSLTSFQIKINGERPTVWEISKK
ncbi:DEAD/DEAH box helicase family protein [Solibacillus sp. NPDC093137]|uniref:DEAD/DEAH box helicase family protein n=1 Tax=Solibacillus sp. NPDC093137 TaxID=3390678 RepID=UPI003D07BDBF